MTNRRTPRLPCAPSDAPHKIGPGWSRRGSGRVPPRAPPATETSSGGGAEPVPTGAPVRLAGAPGPTCTTVTVELTASPPAISPAGGKPSPIARSGPLLTRSSPHDSSPESRDRGAARMLARQRRGSEPSSESASGVVRERLHGPTRHPSGSSSCRGAAYRPRSSRSMQHPGSTSDSTRSILCSTFARSTKSSPATSPGRGSLCWRCSLPDVDHNAARVAGT